ncbi:MAG: serine O-acetyltransferase [Acetobacter sp.]|uniref:serine O-acetyltransferase n=1 Tax=Acetobacter sp. TaxID=440 RepID=UPI0039E867D2
MEDPALVFVGKPLCKTDISSSFEGLKNIYYQRLWEMLKSEANPFLKIFFEKIASITTHTDSGFAEGLSFLLSEKLSVTENRNLNFYKFFHEIYRKYPDLLDRAASDLIALHNRDPAVADYGTPFLEFKGYHALQLHRVSHVLWNEQRKTAARFLQSMTSELCDIDIHPAAALGARIILDHGTGIVIGETTIIEDDVILFQDVTLGGTGKESGKRHPTVREGVVIGPGSKILGAIEIGRGAKVGAGSVVVKNVAPFTCVFGSPAQVVGRHTHIPGLTFDQSLPAIDYIL